MRRLSRRPRRPKTRHPSHQRNRVYVRRPKRRRASLSVVKHAESPEAKRHKSKYDTEYESTPERLKYREELRQERRKRGIDGKGGPDMSHTKRGTLVAESPHANRARHFKERGTLKSQMMAISQLCGYETISKNIKEGTSFDLPASHWAEDTRRKREAEEEERRLREDPTEEERMMDEATGKVGVAEPRTRRLQRTSKPSTTEAQRVAVQQKLDARAAKQARKEEHERLFGRKDIDAGGTVPGSVREQIEDKGGFITNQPRFHSGQWVYDDNIQRLVQLDDAHTHMGSTPEVSRYSSMEDIGQYIDDMVSHEEKWDKAGRAMGLSDKVEPSIVYSDAYRQMEQEESDKGLSMEDPHDEIDFDAGKYNEQGHRIRPETTTGPQIGTLQADDPKTISETEALALNERQALRDLPQDANTAAMLDAVDPAVTYSSTEGDVPVFETDEQIRERMNRERGLPPEFRRLVGVRPGNYPDFGNRTRRREGEGPFGEPFHE